MSPTPLPKNEWLSFVHIYTQNCLFCHNCVVVLFFLDVFFGILSVYRAVYLTVRTNKANLHYLRLLLTDFQILVSSVVRNVM